ncbi:MAG: hypothetical protein WBE72_08920 [Terracidiphilus sp.]
MIHVARAGSSTSAYVPFAVRALTQPEQSSIFLEHGSKSIDFRSMAAGFEPALCHPFRKMYVTANRPLAATQFAEVRGAEIPEHAPFDVVGVLVHDPISQ